MLLARSASWRFYAADTESEITLEKKQFPNYFRILVRKPINGQVSQEQDTHILANFSELLVMGFWIKWLIVFWATQDLAQAHTANYVDFQFLNNGRYRVTVRYTVPALKEFRDAHVEFVSKKEAEKFYFDMIRGADFYFADPKRRRFINEPLKPEVW